MSFAMLVRVHLISNHYLMIVYLSYHGSGKDFGQKLSDSVDVDDSNIEPVFDALAHKRCGGNNHLTMCLSLSSE